MKLFLITRVVRAHTNYDIARSMVVRAKDEQQAREEAALKAMDEGKEMWLDAEKSHCEELTPIGDAQVI
ncbi:MAG: hypothetical protein LC687_03990, partial [Actinobacteria bacterium]|nr:hypothetical protein [Actinomycetota bacterium]MCA1807001.1 hypothetical protein [Actinomycetota bacterium]